MLQILPKNRRSQYSYITYSIKVDGLSNSVIEHEDLSSYPSKTIAFAYWPTGATARSFSQLARIRCPLVPIMSAYPRVFAVHRGNDDDVNVHSLDRRPQSAWLALAHLDGRTGTRTGRRAREANGYPEEPTTD